MTQAIDLTPNWSQGKIRRINAAIENRDIQAYRAAYLLKDLLDVFKTKEGRAQIEALICVYNGWDYGDDNAKEFIDECNNAIQDLKTAGENFIREIAEGK